MKLQDKVALITGGGSGIGRASAILFAQEGAVIAVSDVNEATAAETAERITSAGGTATVIPGDVSNTEGARTIVAATIEAFGRVDILINSAGVATRHAPEGATFDEAWDFVMGINLRGTVMMSRFATDEMKKTGGGAVVNLSSIYGLVGRPSKITDGYDPYTHSKGAIVQLTREAGAKLAPDGIRTNCLCPGFVHTNLTKGISESPETLAYLESLTPMGRFGQPEEIAKAALFLASDDASYVTGAALSVDGGYVAQ
ncbi:MAG: glucose 1-dehydrogenase [Chloroflexi bacterium]|nr:glucose 1-dehydrogenase [Chloroflexota bacterium]